MQMKSKSPIGTEQGAGESTSAIGASFPRLNEIVRGKRSVTSDTALRLARVLGVSAGFWLGLQQDWDLWHAMPGNPAAIIRGHTRVIGCILVVWGNDPQGSRTR